MYYFKSITLWLLCHSVGIALNASLFEKIPRELRDSVASYLDFDELKALSQLNSTASYSDANVFLNVIDTCGISGYYNNAILSVGSQARSLSEECLVGLTKNRRLFPVVDLIVKEEEDLKYLLDNVQYFGTFLTRLTFRQKIKTHLAEVLKSIKESDRQRLDRLHIESMDLEGFHSFFENALQYYRGATLIVDATHCGEVPLKKDYMTQLLSNGHEIVTLEEFTFPASEFHSPNMRFECARTGKLILRYVSLVDSGFGNFLSSIISSGCVVHLSVLLSPIQPRLGSFDLVRKIAQGLNHGHHALESLELVGDFSSGLVNELELVELIDALRSQPLKKFYMNCPPIHSVFSAREIALTAFNSTKGPLVYLGLTNIRERSAIRELLVTGLSASNCTLKELDIREGSLLLDQDDAGVLQALSVTSCPLAQVQLAGNPFLRFKDATNSLVEAIVSNKRLRNLSISFRFENRSRYLNLPLFYFNNASTGDLKEFLSSMMTSYGEKQYSGFVILDRNIEFSF